MANTIEVKVPDIGGYDDVPVIELLVAVGDTVKQDQGLVTLESDKATMEVPSSAAGKVVELKVKVGDKGKAQRQRLRSRRPRPRLPSRPARRLLRQRRDLHNQHRR